MHPLQRELAHHEYLLDRLRKDFPYADEETLADVAKLRRRIAPVVKKLKARGTVLSAFVEPDVAQIRASAKAGFDAVELWTGGYAHARGPKQVQAALARLTEAIAAGADCGLEVHGGHGLTYRNIGPAAAVPGFAEFNIGHSIVSRAIFVGMREAVREMKALLVRFTPKENG